MEEIFHADMGPEDLEPFGLALYAVAENFPVTMRSKNKRGIRIENDKVIDRNYSGPFLEKALETGQVQAGIPETGTYAGIPVVVSPIFNRKGEVVAALGVVDLRHTGEGFPSRKKEKPKPKKP
jgi:hypothetical protein